jgi:ATP-dependent RNA helicase RhlE
MVPEDYLHRIGRTGRAGSEGDAISLVCVDEDGLLRDIERLLGRRIDVEIVPGYEPDRSIRPQAIRLRTGMGGQVGPRPGRPMRPSFGGGTAARGGPGAASRGGVGVGFGARPSGPHPHGGAPHAGSSHIGGAHFGAPQASHGNGSWQQGSRPQGSPPHRNAARRGPAGAAPSRQNTPWRNGAPPPVNPSGHGPRPSGGARPSAGSGRPAATGLGNRPFSMPGERLARHGGQTGRPNR